MSTANDMHSAQLLMVGPLLPALIDEISANYQLHRWWDIEDKQAFLTEHADAIRGIVTSGRFGATRELMESLPNLEAIISFGVGYDPIDIEAAKERNLVVTNTPGVLDECVADTALALMLSVSRRIGEGERFVRSGRWPGNNFPLGVKLGGKVCGIAGLGNIGRQIAKRAEAFGMDIAYYNRKQRHDVPDSYTYYSSLKALAKAADYLVLVVPGGTETRHMINADILDTLGSESFLINVARGTVVDENALIAALQEKRIAGAGLDVFEHEPEVPSALMDMENVALTPHLASGTHETRQAMANLLMENLNGYFLNGKQVKTPIF